MNVLNTSKNFSNLLRALLVLFAAITSVTIRNGRVSTLPKCSASEIDVNLTTMDLVQLRGFKAVNHNVTTSDGYILNVVRCTNPLINRGESGLTNRDVVLFVHGTITNANFFIANSIGAHPKDYSQLDVSLKSQEELIEMFKDDPNKNSLPFLLLNLGHEVWLLNRRGTYQSQRKVKEKDQILPNPPRKPNATSLDDDDDYHKLHKKRAFISLDDSQTKMSFDLDELTSNPILSEFLNVTLLNARTSRKSYDSSYWNYTLDQQTMIDIPEVIDYVLNVTNREKLAYVGHSVGGLLILAGMSEISELNEKISVALLWAPALYTKSYRVEIALRVFKPILELYVGPVVPTLLIPIVHDVAAILCRIPSTQKTFCEPIESAVFGRGGDQQTLLPGMMTILLDTYGTRSLLHLSQIVEKGKFHRFDYGNRLQNMIAYGFYEPLLYNVSKITNTKLTFWGGNTDGLVPIERIQLVIDDLTVEPAQVVYIDKPDIFFNHASFAIHKNVGNILNIPSLKTLSTVVES